MVSETVVPTHSTVPNPYTLLKQVLGTTKYFSVLDSRMLFLCVPLHPESQKVLPLSGKIQKQGKPYTRVSETVPIYLGLPWREN